MAYLRIGDEVPKKGRGSKLTRLQLRFIEEFCDPASIGYNSPSNAVRESGYRTKNPNKMGMQLMSHPLVAEEIKKRMAERKERLELSADYVIHKLLILVEEARRDGDKIRALELLGKNLGIFKERQEISGPDGGAIEYEQRIKEDVANFASKLRRLTGSPDDKVVPLRKTSES